MDWVAVGKVVVEAAAALYGYLTAQADVAERDRKQQEMLNALAASETEIVNALVELNRAQLKGQIQGVFREYDDYDPDPLDPQEEARLVLLIATAAGLLGWLGVNIDDLTAGHEPPRSAAIEATVRDLALECAALTIPLLYLRAQAMANRQRTYGAQEIKDIHEMLDAAIPRFTALASYLRRESNGRFGEITRRRPNDRTGLGVRWEYAFEGRRVQCDLATEDGSLDRCRRARILHRRAEYRQYLAGAGPTLEAAVKEMERTLEQLARPGLLLPVPHPGPDPGGPMQRQAPPQP